MDIQRRGQYWQRWETDPAAGARDVCRQKRHWVQAKSMDALYCPDAAVEGNGRADRLAGKAFITSGLCLARSEVLRSLRHYLWVQNHGHHTIDRIAERVVEEDKLSDDLP